MSEWKPYEIEEQDKWRPDLLDTEIPRPIRLLLVVVRWGREAALSAAESLKRIDDAFTASLELEDLRTRHHILQDRFLAWLEGEHIAMDALEAENEKLRNQMGEVELMREKYEAYCRELRE